MMQPQKTQCIKHVLEFHIGIIIIIIIIILDKSQIVIHYAKLKMYTNSIALICPVIRENTK